MPYRITRYDGRTMSFKSVTITKYVNIPFVRQIEACGDYAKVCRCNARGNNYSGREVYPAPELKNLTNEEEALYGGL